MKRRQILAPEWMVIVMAGLHGAWLSLRTEAEEVEWGLIMLILVGHVKQFGLSPKTNGKMLKDFKLWSHMVIFALNILPQGTD